MQREGGGGGYIVGTQQGARNSAGRQLFLRIFQILEQKRV